MNANLNPLLKETRERLQLQVRVLQEARVGVSRPTEPTTPETMPPVAPDSHEAVGTGSQIGSPVPVNLTPTQEELNRYIVDIIRGVMAQYECSKDDAIDLVFEVADDLAEEGALPPMPEEGESTEDEVIQWMNAAKSMGFGAEVMAYAEEEADAEGEEEEDLTQPEIEASTGV